MHENPILLSSHFEDKDKLILRRAGLEDLESVICLIKAYEQEYINDFSKADPEEIKALIQKHLFFIVEAHTMLAGVFYFDEIVQNLHGQAHLLIWPRFLKQAVKQNIFFEIINFGFNAFNLLKIKAMPYRKQKTAIKLLKRYHFKAVALLQNETVIDGKLSAQWIFELHRNYWIKQHQK